MAGVLRREKFNSIPAFSFADLEHQARAILEEAHAQARRIVAEAEEEGRRRAAVLEQAAKPRGYETGRREAYEQTRAEAAQAAMEEARREYTGLSVALTSGLAEFEQDKRRMLAIAEGGIIALAVAIARRVCKHAAAADSATARENVRALLEMVKHENDIQLHLNPAECDTMQAALPDMVEACNNMAHVQLLPDPNVAKGDCLLKTHNGMIDATLDTQLDRIASALLKSTAGDAARSTRSLHED